MPWLAFLVLSLFRVATIGRMLESNDPPGDRKPKPSDILDQYGRDAVRMAERLAEVLGDNYNYRRKRDELQTEVDGLKGRVAPEGAVVLTGDEAAAYEAYKALGKPDEVQTKLGQVETLSTELNGLKRDATLRDVAQAAGYQFPVLKRLGAEREYEVRDEQQDGKAVRRPYIKDGDTFKPLSEVAERDPEWAPFLPVLTAGGAGQGQQATGVRVPAQGSGERPAPPNPATDYLDRTYGPRKTT